MVRQKVNVHSGKKSNITVTGATITVNTVVRDSPFKDRDDPTIKLGAVKKSATAGSITIELTGHGPHSVTRITTTGTDGALLVTLSDPSTGNLPPMPTDVTYIDDPTGTRHPKPKVATKTTAKTKATKGVTKTTAKTKATKGVTKTTGKTKATKLARTTK